MIQKLKQTYSNPNDFVQDSGSWSEVFKRKEFVVVGGICVQFDICFSGLVSCRDCNDWVDVYSGEVSCFDDGYRNLQMKFRKQSSK